MHKNTKRERGAAENNGPNMNKEIAFSKLLTGKRSQN
jgi:hypothetical protein